MPVFVTLDGGATGTVTGCFAAPYSFDPAWIDVTNVSPRPGPGWTFNGTTWTPAVPDPAIDNARLIRNAASTALVNNGTFLGTVATRRTAIATAKSTATTGTTVTIANVAAAQVQIRAIYTLLVQVATALDDLNNQAEANTKQNDAAIRLLLNRLDSIADV